MSRQISLYLALSVLFCVFNVNFSQETSDDSNLCSATNAYVAITTSGIRNTLLSAQALFTPYTYQLDSTEVVLVDNGCANASDISSTVEDKVAMVWRGGNCSEHSKVATLEQAGAVAVLVANDRDVNYVETIADDNTVILSTTIPTRMITQEDGTYIEDYIESGSVNGTLEIEIGCLNSNYSSALCIVDYSGEYWYMDGDYEQQASDIITYNGHPVFTKEYYYGLVSTLYIYLEDFSGDEDWHWVIGWDYENGNAFSNVEAYCVNTSVTDPADCPVWATQDDAGGDADSADDFSVNLEFQVSSGLCDIAEAYVCINSEDNNVGMYYHSDFCLCCV